MKEENNEVVNSKKSNRIVLYIVIAVIIMMIGIWVGYLLHDNVKNQKENNDVKQNIIENGVEWTTNNSHSEILKNLYSDAVRHIFNESVSYCGDTDNDSLELNGFSYSKSSSFKSFKELDDYVKSFMTESLLKKAGYNDTDIDDGIVIPSYYEKDGSLYCNGWNKGGNIELANYLIDESTFYVSNINSIT